MTLGWSKFFFDHRSIVLLISKRAVGLEKHDGYEPWFTLSRGP